MKFIFAIIIFLLILTSCKKKQEETVNATLSITKKENGTFLSLKITNNTNESIYLPKLDMLLYKSLSIFNNKGNNITNSFFDYESSHNISYYGPPSKVRYDSFCNSIEYTLTDINDLDLPPFTERRQIIQDFINFEYKRIILEHQTSILSEGDVAFIKNCIFFKYYRSVFLRSNETYSECITINTLTTNGEPYKFHLHYTPIYIIDSLTHKFRYSKDSIVITSKLLKQFKEFTLYNGTIKTDTVLYFPELQE